MVSYSGRVDAVFRALADPTRRALLDALQDGDGQTLVALTARHEHDAGSGSRSTCGCSRRRAWS